jgi:hypothetical protein
MSYQSKDADMLGRSSIEITVPTSPTRQGNVHSPRPLYTTSLSANQTALVDRDAFQSGPCEVALERSENNANSAARTFSPYLLPQDLPPLDIAISSGTVCASSLSSLPSHQYSLNADVFGGGIQLVVSHL